MIIHSLWFGMLGVMLAAYAVLDGYDLGVGAAHLWLARSDGERRLLLNSIGPVWNGNEVWLLAAGGMMVVSFPRLYAAAFSGFYLALVLVLWLLILRGVSIEFRGKIDHELWRALWDAGFCLGSLLLALLLGVALGNVLRGLPIGPRGVFQGTFALMLNPYALLTGVLGVAVLAWHGLNFLRGKTEGVLHARALAWSRRLWWASLLLALLATAATFALRPAIGANFVRAPWALALPALSLFGFAWSRSGAGARADRRAFAGSALAIVGLLGSAAATVYPALLPSTLDPAYSLTIDNAASSPHAMVTSFIANLIGMTVVAAYSLYLHRLFRGKTRLGEHAY
jgi:cytochrome d ubiquinol oxidase subunit II